MFHYQNSKTERRLHSDMVIESIVSQAMCVDENYVGERIVIDLTVFDCFYIGDYEEIDVRRIKYKVVAEDDEKEIVEKLYGVMSKENSTV